MSRREGANVRHVVTYDHVLDVEVAALAGEQFNRVSSSQLRALGASRRWVVRRVDVGRLIRVEPGVFAVPPLIDDDRGRWMGATLVARPSYLCDVSAAVAWGFLSYEGPTRPWSAPAVADHVG